VLLGMKLVFDSQPSQDRPIDRVDEIAAQFFPWERLLVDQRNFIAALR
jgi:hypothetical protein